jgi:hypothetical protein
VSPELPELPGKLSIVSPELPELQGRQGTPGGTHGNSRNSRNIVSPELNPGTELTELELKLTKLDIIIAEIIIIAMRVY